MKPRVKKPKSKARNIIEWTLTIIFGAAFLALGVAQIDGMIHQKDNYGQTLRFGWGSFVVLTTSMEPEIKKDTAIITYKENPAKIVEEFKSGKTVDLTFYNIASGVSRLPADYPKHNYRVTNTAVFTHRLFEVYVDETVAEGQGRYYFYVEGINTQGDDWKASQYQLFTEKELLGVVKANSPALGTFFRIISSPWGLLIFLLVPAGYLVVVSVLDIFKAMKDDEAAPAGGPSSGGDAPSDPNDPLAGLSEEDKKRLKEQMLEEMISGKEKGK